MINKIASRQNPTRLPQYAKLICMFQEIFSDGLTRVHNVSYPLIVNVLWHMLTGQRFPNNEHGKAQYYAEQAFRTHRSDDITGNALLQTPWIQFFAPYYSGFTDLIVSTKLTQIHGGNSMLCYFEGVTKF
jgi:hypothetical protein